MTAAALPVIIPVKALELAKQRLARALTPDERRQLVLAMLADMLDTLAQAPLIGPILVVTPDPNVAELAQVKGGTVLFERTPAGLNAAVLRGLADHAVRAAGQALVLPGDIPLISRHEVARLSAGVERRPRIRLVPARDGDGTNAMLLSPPDVLDPSFGPGSFVRHLAAAVARRIDTGVLQLDGIATDIDVPSDLESLLRERRQLQRYAFLQGERVLDDGPPASF